MSNDVPLGMIVFVTAMVVACLAVAARHCSTCDGICPDGLEKIHTRDGCICVARPR